MTNAIVARVPSLRRMAVCAVMAGLIFATQIASAASIDTSRNTGDDHLTLALSYDSVGLVFADEDADGNLDWQGSGTYINRGSMGSWVLTAGHMVYGNTDMVFTFQDYAFDAGSPYGVSGAVESDYFVAHNKWNGDLGAGYDIALMHFDADFSLQAGAADLYTANDEIGKTGTYVGYGLLTSGETGYDGGYTWDGKKRAVENVIDVELLTRGKDNRVLLADFDSGAASDNNWGSATGLALEGSITPGDSGGGMFIHDDASMADLLAGVNSFGWGRLDGNPDSDFGDAFGVTRVSSFISWIDSTIAGYESLLAGGGTDGGDGGSGKTNNGQGRGKNKTSGSSIVSIEATTAVAVPAPAALPAGLALLGILGMRRRRRSA